MSLHISASPVVSAAPPAGERTRRATVAILATALAVYVSLSVVAYLVDDREPAGYYGGRHTDVIVVALQLFVLAPALALFAYAHRGTAIAWSLIAPRLRWTIALFAIALVLTTVFMHVGLYIGDEAAYLFQARNMLAGRFATEAPPIDTQLVPDSVSVFRLNNFIIHDGRWFGKYPPGWPALVALGAAMRIEFAVAPVLGILMTILAYRVAALLFDVGTARLAAVFVAICPLAIYNSTGFLSHVASAAITAAAALAFFKARQLQSTGWYAAMGGLLGFGILVRPWTAALTGAVLVGASILTLRTPRKVFLTLLPVGLFAVLGACLFLLYNRATTGEYLVTGYKMYSAQSGWPMDFNFTPAWLFGRALTIARWSFEATMMNAFPLVLPLAAAALWRERRRRFEVTVLCSLFGAIVIGHLGVAGPSDSRFPERYWFDVFFCVGIVAARGVALLFEWLRPSRRAIVAMTAVVAIASAVQLTRYASLAARWPQPFSSIMKAAEGMRDAVVFLPEGRIYTARDFGGNLPDWKQQPVFYAPDPGASRRAVVAASLRKKSWAVLLYDSRTGKTNLLSSGEAAAGRQR